MKNIIIYTLLLFLGLHINIFAQESRELVVDNPDAIVDLRTQKGIKMLNAQWKYSDAKIVDDKFGAFSIRLSMFASSKREHRESIRRKYTIKCIYSDRNIHLSNSRISRNHIYIFI